MTTKKGKLPLAFAARTSRPCHRMKRPCRCIYCLEEKPPADFNTEHVLPQAFGRFGGQSPTLRCVCRKCNSYFSKEIEQSFSRGSVEGVHRYFSGLKLPTDFNVTRPSNVRKVNVVSGPLVGVPVGFGLLPTEDALGLVPHGVGFAKTPDGPFRWFRIEDLPSQEELKAEFGPDGPEISAFGISEADLKPLLASIGVIVQGEPIISAVSGTACTEIDATVTRTDLRVIAKVALNYLAFCQPGLVYLPEFNEVRRYVRDNADPQTSFFESIIPTSIDAPGRLKCHVLSVRSNSQDVSSRVVLMGILEYRLILNLVPLLVAAQFDSVHTFDLATMTANHAVRKGC